MTKMETTDFAKHLTHFLVGYLAGERNASKHTICSYRDTFMQLIHFMKQEKGIDAQRIKLEVLNKETIVNFLRWIQQERKCGSATRNNRLAAIHSFFRYLQYECPERIYEWQRVLSIKVQKQETKNVNYLDLDGIKLILAQIDVNSKSGRRNLAMLAFLYDSGARVQELIDLTPSSLRLETPCIVKLVGKGRKARIVPLQDEQVILLKNYMQENKLMEIQNNEHPLFFNSWGNKLTRSGISYVLKTYTDMARKVNPALIPDRISCHSLRHSKAMHLLQAGVNLVYIRDILGHVSIQTTEVYARADSKQKREALEKAYTNITPPQTEKEMVWEKDNALLEWLKGLNK
jgi:site-specific recombinase XerD